MRLIRQFSGVNANAFEPDRNLIEVNNNTGEGMTTSTLNHNFKRVAILESIRIKYLSGRSNE